MSISPTSIETFVKLRVFLNAKRRIKAINSYKRYNRKTQDDSKNGHYYSPHIQSVGLLCNFLNTGKLLSTIFKKIFHLKFWDYIATVKKLFFNVITIIIPYDNYFQTSRVNNSITPSFPILLQMRAKRKQTLVHYSAKKCS